MKEYNGITLDEIDYNVIAKLEEKIGKKIDFFDFTDDIIPTTATNAKNGKIIYLSIDNKNIYHFPNEILDLLALENLAYPHFMNVTYNKKAI